VLLDGTRPGCFKIRFQGKTLKLYKAQQDKLRGFAYGSLYGVVIVIYISVTRFLFSGEFNFNPFFGLESWIGGVLLIGFTEEIVFRGFYCRNLKKLWTANTPIC